MTVYSQNIVFKPALPYELQFESSEKKNNRTVFKDICKKTWVAAKAFYNNSDKIFSKKTLATTMILAAPYLYFSDCQILDKLSGNPRYFNTEMKAIILACLFCCHNML